MIYIDHTALTNIRSKRHSQIDTFISSKAQNSGLASLDSNDKLTATQIPAIALVSVNVVNATADRDKLVV